MHARMLVADGREGLRRVDVDHPAPGPGALRVLAECSLVSPGTELHYLDDGLATGRSHPLGYCSAGVVEAAGPGTGGFAPGTRVIAMGWGHAVHSDVVTVPYRLCTPVPDGVGLADAVVANLGATAVHALDRAAMAPGTEVLVVGAGAVGQLVAQVAAAAGHRVTLTDARRERLDSARGLGMAVADPGQVLGFAGAGRGARCVFLCVTGDATEIVTAAARWAAAAPGRPLLIAVGRFSARVEFSVALGNADFRYSARCGAGYRDDDYAHGRAEVTAPRGEGTVTQNLARALDLVTRGAIRPSAMSIPDYPIEAAETAYAELRERPNHVSARFGYGGQA